MPIAIILIGSSLWLTFVIKGLAIADKVDNFALVNVYSSMAMLGLWLMGLGAVWLLLRKR
jgi:hypothetical protein